MKLNSLRLSLLVLTTTAFSGCEVIGGIFKAGMWSAVIIIVVIVALILFLVGKRKR